MCVSWSGSAASFAPNITVTALFALALEKPADKRPAFLDARCEGNAFEQPGVRLSVSKLRETTTESKLGQIDR